MVVAIIDDICVIGKHLDAVDVRTKLSCLNHSVQGFRNNNGSVSPCVGEPPADGFSREIA